MKTICTPAGKDLYVFLIFLTQIRPLLATFINAGAVGLVNVVSLLVFTEMLCRGVHFALSFIGWIVFWAWHAIVLYWVGSSYNSNTGVVILGTYLALHLGSLVVAFIVSWVAAIGSVPASFRMYTVAHKSIMTWVKITFSAIVAAGIVVGVVLLSQDKDLRVLVSIIGDLPLLSVISISYLYYNADTKANDLRRFTHFIQLLYKSTPLFLCLFPVALVWQHTCGDAGGWGWRILTSVVVFLITAMYNLAVYLWARTYSDFDAEPQPAMYKQLRQNWSF